MSAQTTDAMEPIPLPVLALALSSSDSEEREDATEQVAMLVGEAFGAEGATLAEMLREAGIIAQLAALVLESQPAQVRANALLALGNLCSDLVDSQSSKTKAVLLQVGFDALLMECVSSTEPSVVLVSCAALQNLCHDHEWAKRMVGAGVEARLEPLLKHADPRVVRYASGALKNLTLASASAGGRAPQLSAEASNAVRQRELEAAREAFMHKRARRAIGRGVRRMDSPKRLERLLETRATNRGVVWLDAVSDVHAALERQHDHLQAELVQHGKTEPSAQLLSLQVLLCAASDAYDEALRLPEVPEDLVVESDEMGTSGEAAQHEVLQHEGQQRPSRGGGTKPDALESEAEEVEEEDGLAARTTSPELDHSARGREDSAIAAVVVEELVEAVPGAEGSPIASASARTVPVHTPSPRGVRGKRGLTPKTSCNGK